MPRLNDLTYTWQRHQFCLCLIKYLNLLLISCRSEKPSISGIFLKKGPYLKLYSSYIRDFEKITTVFDEACGRFPLFGAAVREFEVRSERKVKKEKKKLFEMKERKNLQIFQCLRMCIAVYNKHGQFRDMDEYSVPDTWKNSWKNERRKVRFTNYKNILPWLAQVVHCPILGSELID